MQLPYRRNKFAGHGFDEEMILEIGMLLFAAGLATGVAALLMGRTSGKARYASRRQESPPANGSISHRQNQNVSTVAAR